MGRTNQVVWSMPQPARKIGWEQRLLECALILILVATMLGSATVTVGHQLSTAYVSVAAAIHP